MKNRYDGRPFCVAIFCRADVNRDAGVDALEAQAAHLRKMIDEHPEWSCSEEFCIRGSGDSVKDAPEFRRMLERCDAGSIDLILTKSVSRFGHDMSDAREMLSELQSRGVDVYFENEDIWLRDMHEQFERVEKNIALFGQPEAEMGEMKMDG